MPKKKPTNNNQPKRIDPTDVYVGQRIRMQRNIKGISQTGLADTLGLSFQQVQKYEKGHNRVSGGKLQAIANFLGVPVSFFFEDGPSAPRGKGPPDPGPPWGNLLSTKEGIALCTAFAKIRSKSLREIIIGLTEYGAGLP